MKNIAWLIICMTVTAHLASEVKVELINATGYDLYHGLIEWKENCKGDVFVIKGQFVSNPQSQVISWSNFLGLGKTCILKSINFVASKYYPEIEEVFMFQKVPITIVAPNDLAIGPNGTCSSMRITINRTPAMQRSTAQELGAEEEIAKEFSADYACIE